MIPLVLQKKVFLPISTGVTHAGIKEVVLAAVWDGVSACLIDPAERRAFSINCTERVKKQGNLKRVSMIIMNVYIYIYASTQITSRVSKSSLL